VTLTPGGFLAAETVWRSRALTADINTPFNTVPYIGSAGAHESEFYGSGRQSRMSWLIQGKLANVNATGYYESDFLSAGVTSNNNQSNSYTFRQRQVWGQAAFTDGWTFTGGQMWSLVTETRQGLDNRTEALPNTIDAQYHVGFSWERQYGVRLTKNFSNNAWLGISVENAEALITAHGNASNFVVGNIGTLGGLYNNQANYSWNLTPDYIVKFAFQPEFGGHYEIFGIASDFRQRIYPNATLSTPNAGGAFNSSVWGGGIGANARWMLAQKRIELGVHYLGGPGVGRYGTTTLPDLTVKPNGQLATLHNQMGLGSFETHTRRLDTYAYFGAEFVGRDYYALKGKPEGYGSPLFNNSGCYTEVLPSGANGFTPGTLANCNGDTRNIMEATFGFWYKPYNGEKGRFQFGPQYSYLIRNTWRGVGGAPNAVDNMIFTSFRYYLP
jgi:hypothetical protein